MTVTELHPVDTTPALEREPTAAQLRAWGDQWFTRNLERRASNKRRWCARWYEHPEVMCRVRILYFGHRQVVKDGDALAMSAWMLDHLARHLDAIQDPDGPFAGCTVDRHSPHDGLTTEARWVR